MAIQNCTNYVTKVIKRAETQNFGSISVKPSKYDEWLKTTQLELTKTVFGSKFGGCSSWYVSDNHNAVNFPYSQPYYWYITAFPDYNALQFFKKVDKKRV